MIKVSGHFVTMPTGWESGAIPKPILESIFSFTGYLGENKLPLISIVLAVVGLIGVV